MNRALPFIGLVAVLLVAMSQTVLADDDLFEFFAEEAQVITASRRPRPIRQVPATVYVVKGEELTRSGVHTLRTPICGRRGWPLPTPTIAANWPMKRTSGCRPGRPERIRIIA